MKLKRQLAKYYVNLRGWSTNRKIVVIESDDWGSIRMPSTEVYRALAKANIPVENSRYTRFDSLETEDDLHSLFEVLRSFKDLNNNSPVFTANTLVGNPDFEKIKSTGYRKYFFETIDKTYTKYEQPNLLNLWKKNYDLLYPQFHGREHLNFKKWLSLLQTGHEQEIIGFEHEALLGIPGNGLKKSELYLSAFEYISEEHKVEIEKATAEGLKLFEQIFGFKSQSFVASQSVRGDHLDKTLKESGVKFHQCGQQFVPSPNGHKIKNRYWGDKNIEGMIYWRRNCTFEPSKDPSLDHVTSCLKEVEIAFRCRKPAVINSHRVNFMGSLSENNRQKSLEKLAQLINSILNKWPDVEFMNSEQLGNLIVKNDN